MIFLFNYTNINIVWATTIRVISKEQIEKQNKQITIKDFFNYFGLIFLIILVIY